MMNTNSFGFEELEIWKKARTLKIEISTTVKSFPAEEKFRLVDQVIRSVRYIGALIEKGMADFLILIKFIFVCRQEPHRQKL